MNGGLSTAEREKRTHTGDRRPAVAHATRAKDSDKQSANSARGFAGGAEPPARVQAMLAVQATGRAACRSARVPAERLEQKGSP
jgi:hypothetical protein